MNAMILLAQGAMNMADSLATANPVLTEVNAPEMNMLDMAVKGGDRKSTRLNSSHRV